MGNDFLGIMTTANFYSDILGAFYGKIEALMDGK